MYKDCDACGGTGINEEYGTGPYGHALAAKGNDRYEPFHGNECPECKGNGRVKKQGWELTGNDDEDE